MSLPLNFYLHLIALLCVELSLRFKLQLGYELFILVAYVITTLIVSAITIAYLLCLASYIYIKEDNDYYDYIT